MNRTEYMIQKYEMYIKMWKKDLENASKNLAEDFIREIKALEEEQQ